MDSHNRSMPDKKMFKKVCADLEAGNILTLSHIGAVFGEDFWIMLVSCLMDSQDAARAIQGAMMRLSRQQEGIDGDSGERQRDHSDQQQDGGQEGQ